MELLSPNLGLIIWTILCLFALGLMIPAIIHLAYNPTFQPSQKWRWLCLIIFLPIAGAFIYFSSHKKKKARV